MAKIELNIVATGEFSQVTSQIKALQAQVDILNKSVAGVGVGSAMAKDMQLASAAFQSTMLSTGQFTMSTVKMTSETEKFGQALVAGKLKLSDYFQIITGKAGQATASLAALTAEQVKLQESVVVSDPTKKGFLQVYTPTTINGVTSATKLATMQQNLYNLSVDAGSKALINWGKNTQWAGRQLTVGLTMPMVMFGAAAVKSFKDTNVELTRLQRLYGEGLTPPSQAQLNQISSQVLDLGKQIAQQMGIAQTETTKVAANFAAMGKQGQDLLDITKQTQRLSKLGGVDATAATNAIVALQNVYRVSTNELANAVNFLSDMQKQTTMSLGDMTDAIPRVGPIMQQLGGTYKDTAVMLLAMKEAGVPAAQAANALKSAMASIIAPTRTATDAASKFGISLDAVKNAGTPVQMIEKLQEGMAKLAPLAKEQLIEKIFGKFQFARISALLDNFGRVGSQTQNALKVAGATNQQLADLANQEMKQATESTTARYQRALEGFKSTLYPIGQEFLKIGAIVLNIANKIGDAFSKLPSPVKTVLGIMAGFAVFAGPVIMLTGLLANFAGYILKGVVNFKQLVSGGKSFKELLTPEIIASTNATQIFGKAMNEDVAAVDLLNTAIKNLTTSMEGLVAAMNVGTGITSLRDAVGATATAESSMFRQMALPGFTKGVFSLQAGGSKGKDTIPALIARGESVISAEMTDKHAGLIKAIIQDKVPGYASSRMPGSYSQNGETIFLSSPGIESAPPALRFGAQYGMEKSGQLSKAIDIIIQSLTDSAGLLTVSESQLKSYIQTDLAHISKSDPFITTLANGQTVSQKQWQMSNLTPAMGVENNFLEQMSRKNMLPYWNAKADQIQTQLGSAITKEQEAAISELRLGHQPITKAGIDIYEKLVAQIEQDALSGIGPVAGSRTQSMLGPTRALQQARLNGALPMPVALSESINTSSSASMSAFKNYQVETTEARKAGTATIEGFIQGEEEALPGLEAYNEKVAGAPVTFIKARLGIKSPSEVMANEVGAPIVQGIIQGAQDALPGLEEFGTQLGTTFTEAVNKPISSIGSDIHADMIAAVEQASGMTMQMHAAGMVGGRAFKSGWQQGELGLSTYIQDTLPGISNVSAGKSWVPEQAYGPLLPNGQMELARRESLVNGSVIKSPLIPKMGAMGISMGAMAASPFISKIGGGSNVVANTAGSVLSNVGMAAMIPMMMPGLNIAMGPLIAGVAAVTVAFKGIQMAMAAAAAEINASKQSFQLTGVAVEHFGISVKPLATYDFAKTGAGLDAHIKSINDNKAAVDSLTQAYLSATDKMTKDYINQVKGDNQADLLTRMNARYSTDLMGGMNSQQAKQDMVSIMNAAGRSAGDVSYVINNMTLPSNAGEALANSVKYAQSKLVAKEGTGSATQNAQKAQIAQQIQGLDDLIYQTKQGLAVQKGAGLPGTKYQNTLNNLESQKKALQAQLNPGTTTSILNQDAIDKVSSSVMTLVQGPIKNYNDALKQLAGNSGTTSDVVMKNKQVFDGIALTMDKSWPGFKKYADQLGSAKGSAAQLTQAIVLLNNAAALGLDPQNIQKLMATPDAISKLYTSKYKDILALEKATGKDGGGSGGGGSTTTTTFTGTAEEKATKKLLDGRIKDQNSVLKTLKDQLSIYQKQSAELKRLRDFDAQRQDINNQMKTALISGNYLQAAMLKQSKSALQVDFNTGTMQYKMQDQIDEVQTRADAFNTALGELTNAMNDATIKFDPQWKKTANQAVLRPSTINSDLSGGTITQNFTIHTNDANVVYQAVSQATADASKKQVSGGVKADIKKPGKPPVKPGKK